MTFDNQPSNMYNSYCSQDNSSYFVGAVITNHPTATTEKKVEDGIMHWLRRENDRQSQKDNNNTGAN